MILFVSLSTGRKWLSYNLRDTCTQDISIIAFVPVANVLEGPRVQWIGPMLHLGLSVSSSDYHQLDVSREMRMVYYYW